MQVAEGDYLLAVNGKALTTADNLFAALLGTRDRDTRLLVSATPSAGAAREIVVRPIGDEEPLRVAEWVETNRRKVAEATGGRAAYIYLPFTNDEGVSAFGRQFYAQTDRSALVLDGRYNGGGYIPDFLMERLARRHLEYDAPRYGPVQKVPAAAIDGPKVLVTNEWAGSGGDSVPDYFRKLALGPIVGKRTWGGLMGVGDEVPAIDGGYVRVPFVAAWDVVGGRSEWIVENHGVDPDVEVDQRPDLVVAGGDPQLERAIAIISAAVAKAPPPPSRPPYGAPAGATSRFPIRNSSDRLRE